MTFIELIEKFRKNVSGEIVNILICNNDLKRLGEVPRELAHTIFITDSVGPGYFIVEETNGMCELTQKRLTKIYYLCIHGNNYMPLPVRHLSSQNCEEPECIILDVMSS